MESVVIALKKIQILVILPRNSAVKLSNLDVNLQ